MFMAMKKITIVLFILTLFLTIIPPIQAATVNSPSLSGIQIFPKDNIWNTRVDMLPVDANTDIYIHFLVTETTLYPGLRHYIRNAIPYNVVNSTQRHQVVTFSRPAYSDDVGYPIPNNPLFEQGSSDQ